MAQIYPLPLANGSNSDQEFRKLLSKSHKIQEFTSYDLALDKLQKYGTKINHEWKPEALKKLRDELYELRSKNVRTLLYFDGNNFFIILHSFLKTTQKTRKGQIQQALKEIKRWKELKKLL